jgi:hypothetical protein
MKATLSCALAAFALTLYAADPQDKPTTTATTLSAVPQAQVEDSPLVRAAKRTGRLSKKPTNVITNETLVKSGGHITTAAYQAPLPAAPPKYPASLNQPNAAERLKKEAQEKAKKEAIAKRAAARRAEADFNNDSIEPRFEDPAQQEQTMQQGAQTTTAQPPQKPPTL